MRESGQDWITGSPLQEDIGKYKPFTRGKINHIKPFYLKRVTASLKVKRIIEIDFENARELSSSPTPKGMRYFIVRYVRLSNKFTDVLEYKSTFWINGSTPGASIEKYPLIICTPDIVGDVKISVAYYK